MGIGQWMKQCSTYSECYIFTDNQAICSSVQKPGQQSGQTILKSIIEQIDDIADRAHHYKLTITWVPGHSDIEWNERADQEAKLAGITPTTQTFEYPHLKSCKTHYIKATSKRQWENEWVGNKTGHHLKRIAS